jgi:translation elongation factor EF-Tu-like GTPase
LDLVDPELMELVEIEVRELLLLMVLTVIISQSSKVLQPEL